MLDVVSFILCVLEREALEEECGLLIFESCWQETEIRSLNSSLGLL